LHELARAVSVAGGPFKFTVTSPYMLARTLLDRHYGSFETLLNAIADVPESYHLRWSPPNLLDKCLIQPLDLRW
jgi:hypothetical protein